MYNRVVYKFQTGVPDPPPHLRGAVRQLDIRKHLCFLYEGSDFKDEALEW